MSSWNMPPGVNTNMIPGNRPEDMLEEAFWEAFGQKLESEGITSIPIPVGTIPPHMKIDDLWDDSDFVKVIQIARDLGYQRGYNEGQMEAEMAFASKMMEAEDG